MVERQVLHVLVDDLPDDELAAAKRFLEFLRSQSKDPLRALLDEAPLDDEPVTEEDLAAIREGFAEEARGKLCPRKRLSAFSSAPSEPKPLKVLDLDAGS